MNKEELLKEIAFLEEKVKSLYENLESYVEKEKDWRDGLVQPSSQEYFIVDSSSTSGLYTLLCIPGLCTPGNDSRKPEHAFETKEQAELVKEKMLLMQEMLAFAHVRNEGWVPKWGQLVNEKYGLVLSLDELFIESWNSYNYFIFGIAVKSKEIAEEMIDIFGERIKKYYSVQY